MTEIPRLTWPLALDATTGRLAAVEQGPETDIRQCLGVITRTTVGDRADLPDMGFPDQTFEEQPIDTEAARGMLARHEPRADITATSSTDLIDEHLAELDITWQPTGGEEA